MASRNLKVYNLLGAHINIDYELVWKFQKVLSERSSHLYKSNQLLSIDKNLSLSTTDQKPTWIDSLILVQHPSIYTIGKGGSIRNLKSNSNKFKSLHQIVRIERGGEITWHGPGQIVAYPIFNLNCHKKDLHWFTQKLEQTVIDTLQHKYNLPSTRSQINTGVWINKNKISAIGLTASRWVTMHGIALNVNCDLTNFQHIIPCGISEPGYGVCSIQQQLLLSSTDHSNKNNNATTNSNNNGNGNKVETCINMNEVANTWIESFLKVFDMQLLPPLSAAKSSSSNNSVLTYNHPDYIELMELLKDYPHIDNLKLDKID